MATLNILLISHDMPPMQSPEAVRTGKYAKYLIRAGFNVFALTSERKKGGLFRRALAHYDIIPDSCGRWIYPAFKEACEIIEREKIDIIFSRSMPIVSHRVALLVHEKYPDIPWIAEFSDPWTQSTYKKYKFGIGRRRDEAYEKKIFDNANIVLATSYRTAELFLDKYPEANGKVQPIPNFYDEEEFENGNAAIMARTNLNHKFERFLIICTGNFYGIRTPEYLFKALKKLEEEKNQNIQVVLVGNLGKYQKLVEQYKIAPELLRIVPPVAREKAIELLVYADAYLLIDAPSKVPSVFLPSKLPEYLYMRKPILALTPTGTVDDIIQKTKMGICVAPDDVPGIVSGIKDISKVIIDTSADISQYSVEKCVQELVFFINRLIAEKEAKVKSKIC